MIRNIPYFRSLDDTLAEEIAYLLRPKRFEAGTDIVKRGDSIDQIILLKAGEIEVLVPHKNNKSKTRGYESPNISLISYCETSNNEIEELIFLDTLNEGSCFCIYSPFNEEKQQLVNFRAKTTCIIESINI